ncbi:MAG: EMC3/TMCO1 family protein [Candidatus Methanoplasma sp.]|nr:EMC3/TMCO1 family protein [Candidatus Methanoplasma sp.]
MPNPGSPQSMSQAQQNNPMPMPKGTMLGMLAVLAIMMVVMQFRMQIGGALNAVFQVIDFGGQYPVLSLVIAGLIMITLSTVIRSYMTDFIAQARNQQIQSGFTKEMRKARLENNLFKLKKLQEKQPAMTAKSMETQTKMMKTMPITMVIILPIYAWVWYFLEETVPDELLNINIPWATDGVFILNSLWVIPIWIVVYTMISLPIGQLENRFVRYIMLKKRLRELDQVESAGR